MTAILSDDFIARVAARTSECEIRIWGFGVGPALVGLVRAGELLREQAWIDRANELVATSLLAPADVTDHLISVEALLALQNARPDIAIEPSLLRFVAAVTQALRPIAAQPAVHRPDLPSLSTILWVDCMHTDGPGLAAIGLDDAARASAEEASSVLQDKSGLYSHAYDISTGKASGVHWGRGQGWALHGLALGAKSGDLSDRLSRLLHSLSRFELDGRWRTIVDNPAAPFEASVSALVASGILLGVRHGSVERGWIPMARRALKAAGEETDDRGGITVSDATPAASPASYLTRASGVFPWGQGPLLLALIEGRNEL